jgi:hypothetical protein
MNLSLSQARDKVIDKMNKSNLTASDECIDAVAKFLLDCIDNDLKLQNVFKHTIPNFIESNQTENLIERYKRILEIGNKVTLDKMILYQAKPAIFKSTDIPKFRGYTNKTAQEIWNKDIKKKAALLEERNMDIYYVWEYDFRNNKLETIEKVTEYVRSKIL